MRRCLTSSEVSMKMLDLINNVIGTDPDVAEFFCNHPLDNVFAIDGAMEILRAPLPSGWGPPSVQVELAKSDEYPLDRQAVQLLTPYRDKLAGLGWEIKHRIAAIEQISNEIPILRVVFVPTTYEEGTGFHRSLVEATAQGDDFALALRERLANQLMQPGRYSTPGVAVVQAIVITSDGYVILCRRSPHAGYHPLRWSVSFEEQINQEDLTFGNAALLAAAVRGFQEEFVPDHTMIPESACILGVFLEYGILNISFCVYIETSLSLNEIKSSWNRKARDKWEAVTMVGEPFTLDNIAKLLRSSNYGEVIEEGDRFHPTSKYRLLLAAIYRFGSDMVIDVFRSL